MQAELEAHVAAEWKAANAFGTLNEGPKLDPSLMFDDVFKTLPDHLRRQREQLAAERAAAVASASGSRSEA